MTELRLCDGPIDGFSNILAEWIVLNKKEKNFHIYELPIWEEIHRLAKKSERAQT